MPAVEEDRQDVFDAELRQFVEDFALVYERWDLPRVGAKILGFLLVCDPPEKTQPELAEYLGASKGSISTMTRLLEQLGMLERVSVPGERKTRYRIRPDAWTRSVEESIERGQSLETVAHRGRELLDGAPERRKQRLDDVLAYAEFWQRELPALLARWNEYSAARQRDRGH